MKMTLRQFWSLSVVMNMVPMFLRQFRSENQHKDTAELCQLTKTANFIATPMKKTYLAVYYLLIGDTSQVSVFFLTNQNE